MFNKQVKFNYAYLFKAHTRKDKIKKMAFLTIVPLLTTAMIGLIFLFFANTKVVNEVMDSIIMVLWVVPIYFFMWSLVKINSDVNRKHLTMKIAMGMSLREYVKGIQWTYKVFVTIFYGTLAITAVLYHQDNLLNIAEMLFILFAWNVFLAAVCVWVSATLKNMNAIWIVLMIVQILTFISTTYVGTANQKTLFESWTHLHLFHIWGWIIGSCLLVGHSLLNNIVIPRCNFTKWMDQSIDQGIPGNQSKFFSFINKYLKKIFKI